MKPDQYLLSLLGSPQSKTPQNNQLFRLEGTLRFNFFLIHLYKL